MNVPELFESSLRLIERVARGVCRRARVEGADADDFVSSARLALLEDDYAVLRAYEGRSSLSTFLNVVFHRLMADQRNRARGKWNPSRDAMRIGRVGVMLETLIHRDGRSIDEALVVLRNVDPSLTRAQLEAMAARLPERPLRPRLVELLAEDEVSSPLRADESLLEKETKELAGRANAIMRAMLAALSVEDRMLIRSRYVAGMTVSDIARILQLPQRPLYRRIEAIQRELREALRAAGVDENAAREIVGSAVAELDFGLSDAENAPGQPSDETAVIATEESK